MQNEFSDQKFYFIFSNYHNLDTVRYNQRDREGYIQFYPHLHYLERNM